MSAERPPLESPACARYWIGSSADPIAAKPHYSSYVVEGALPRDVCPGLEALLDLSPKSRTWIMIFDKRHKKLISVETPRRTLLYMRDYFFSGTVNKANPVLPAVLRALLEYVNAPEQRAKWSRDGRSVWPAFNQVLVNFYKDGSECIRPHSDDESQLVVGAPILSVSFGEARFLRVRRKRDGSIAQDFVMHDGTYIVMGGDFQKEFTHEVPKVHDFACGQGAFPCVCSSVGWRVNVTFRVFKYNILSESPCQRTRSTRRSPRCQRVRNAHRRDRVPRVARVPAARRRGPHVTERGHQLAVPPPRWGRARRRTPC